MKYFKQFIGKDEVKEITKQQARDTLTGWWKEECLEDVFTNNKSFRLYNPFSIVWTETDAGLIPIAGFYGVCD